MKHIMEKKVQDATSLELLSVLMHTEGMAEGPNKTVHAEPVMETFIPIGPDRTARIVVFEDDLETLKQITIGG